MASTISIIVTGILILVLSAPTSQESNLALNRPTFHSTIDVTYGHPDAANNGDTNTHLFQTSKCTHTIDSRSKDPWWAVDLGVRYKVTKVTLLNRSDCCSTRLHDFYVGALDGVPTSPVAPGQYPVCGLYPGVVGSGARAEMACAPDTMGRYLIVQIPGASEILTLCEVQVYGTEVEIAGPYRLTAQFDQRLGGDVIEEHQVLSVAQCIHVCAIHPLCRSVNVGGGDGRRVCYRRDSRQCALTCQLNAYSTNPPTTTAGWKWYPVTP